MKLIIKENRYGKLLLLDQKDEITWKAVKGGLEADRDGEKLYFKLVDHRLVLNLGNDVYEFERQEED